jgi:tRNA(Ile2) C34 agmatinyltransferase TiaS
MGNYMTETNKRCKCGNDISNRGNNVIRCNDCQKRYRKEYKKLYHKKINELKLGNPDQDEEILNFIRKKREKYEKKRKL